MTHNREATESVPELTRDQFLEAGSPLFRIKPVQAVSTLWFGREVMERVAGANKDLEEALRSKMDVFVGPGGSTRSGEHGLGDIDEHGLVTMVSPDERTGISLCKAFLDVRCSELSLSEARTRIESLMQVILAGPYPRNSGLTIEFHGVIGDILGIQHPVDVLSDRALCGYSRDDLNKIIGHRVTAAKLRLYFESGDVKYTFDMGPDAVNPKDVLVHQRSKRTSRSSFAAFKGAWNVDIELWDKIAEPLVAASLRSGS